LALAAVALIRPPAAHDEMALPDRTAAAIVRDFARKVIDDIAALARAPIERTQPQIGHGLDYDIELVRAGARDVPQVFHASLPAELTLMRHTPERKDRFLALVLPLVLKANAEIAADRTRLARLAKARGAGMSAEDSAWLSWMAERYGTDEHTELLRRVDIIPPSLALAQAAEESGWGTSRFAHQGNALFGQRAFGEELAMTAAERTDDETVRVRAYENLAAAVRSYARNLNTHAAYAPFREARAAARAEGAPVRGHDLAETLIRYSERGLAYVQSLRAIIRLNRLDAFDAARLGSI
jgi:Bax protein